MICDPDLINDAANITLDAIEAGIADAGLAPITRTYQGMGPVPAEDCCPDLVVWGSNIALYDFAVPNTLQENRILSHVGISFDLNVRIGLCFWETDQEGNLNSPAQIDVDSKAIHRYVTIAYTHSITALLTNEVMQARADSITPGTAIPFQSGGCAGFEWAHTISVV